MSQIIPEEIEHLDFEPEKEDGYSHHRHPTMPNLRWCGSPIPPDKGTWMNKNGTKGSTPTCPRCLALIEAFGYVWYWETHRKHYGSNCTNKDGIVYHDCGA